MYNFLSGLDGSLTALVIGGLSLSIFLFKRRSRNKKDDEIFSAPTLAKRLGIIEHFDLGEGKKLLLVRRDDYEHLLFLSDTGNFLVESKPSLDFKRSFPPENPPVPVTNVTADLEADAFQDLSSPSPKSGALRKVVDNVDQNLAPKRYGEPDSFDNSLNQLESILATSMASMTAETSSSPSNDKDGASKPAFASGLGALSSDDFYSLEDDDDDKEARDEKENIQSLSYALSNKPQSPSPQQSPSFSLEPRSQSVPPDTAPETLYQAVMPAPGSPAHAVLRTTSSENAEMERKVEATRKLQEMLERKSQSAASASSEAILPVASSEQPSARSSGAFEPAEPRRASAQAQGETSSQGNAVTTASFRRDAFGAAEGNFKGYQKMPPAAQAPIAKRERIIKVSPPVQSISLASSASSSPPSLVSASSFANRAVDGAAKERSPAFVSQVPPSSPKEPPRKVDVETLEQEMSRLIAQLDSA